MRKTGEKGRGDAARTRANETGGDSGEDERDDAADCREDEGRRS